MACLILLAACAGESDRAKSELETVRATHFPSRTDENAALCSAYQKLRAAYLKEGKRAEYESTQVFVTAHC